MRGIRVKGDPKPKFRRKPKKELDEQFKRDHAAVRGDYVGSERDFSQKREDWEAAVFRNAIGFSASMRSGPGTYETYEFKLPKEAMDKALTMKGAYGRQAIVYAYTENGRRIVLDRKDWEMYLQLWDSTH